LRDFATIADNFGPLRIICGVTPADRFRIDKFMTSETENHAERHPKTSLRFVKYTLIYILLVPFINWTFSWNLKFPVFPGSELVFNPITIITGLILVVRDFAQREVGHEVLIAMFIALVLTAYFAGPELALASGLAFFIAEIVDWAMFTFTKFRLSSRVLLSSALAAPIDTTVFLYFAESLIPNSFTMPNITMSIVGKMFGALVIWALLRQRRM